MDPTNLDPKFINEFSELKEEDCQVYFPETFAVDVPVSEGKAKPEYSLHSRVYSTHTSGVHYFTIGKVQTESHKSSLYKLDNLSYSAKLINDLKDITECPKQLQVARNTMFVCYKLKH